MNFQLKDFLCNTKAINGNWYVEIFNTSNGKRIDYNNSIDIDTTLNILISGLSRDEAIRQCYKLSKELNIPIFDNCYDAYIK